MRRHPADAVLKAYADGALDEAAEASVEKHYLGCTQCVARLEWIVTANRLGVALIIPKIIEERPVWSRRALWAAALAAAAMLGGVTVGVKVLQQPRLTVTTPATVMGKTNLTSSLRQAPSRALANMNATASVSVRHEARRQRSRRSTRSRTLVAIGPTKRFEPPPVAELTTDVAYLEPPTLIRLYEGEDPLQWVTEEPTVPVPEWKPKRNPVVRFLSLVVSPFRSSD